MSEYNNRQERMAAYTGTARGKRFLRSMELSKEFLHKYEVSGRGLSCEEVFFLADRAHSNPVTALFDMYALAYRMGYNTAWKKAKNAQKAK